ncbi:oxidoreductase [Trinickia symbiotica]|uniref:Oxidoreductase n=1 Tax=Trinickia symbiotica TaxID=863227 RepID=A0A2T3XKM0_9BURK|nr:PDR/VanB family oxidoreductase [Trinickia symbiotica]PTB17081.1 oxidoreductase [Trinickia symbiotica]
MKAPLLIVRVARKISEAESIASFELIPVEGNELPAFSAGAHIDVHLPGRLVRQYSLCNAPSEIHRYVICVLRDASGRGGSRVLHDVVKEGDTLEISFPKNHFPLARSAQRSVLLAGGIGVTPILCMAEHLAAQGEDFEMHYCARSVNRMAFIERIVASSFASRVALHFDDGPEHQKLELESFLTKRGNDTHLYICGPQGFMDAVLATARGNGWPEAQLHYEFFRRDLTSSGPDQGFQVRLAHSGRVINVTADQTVVEALADAGIEVPTSCEQGICGTCLTQVLEGEPDHRDMYLTREEHEANDCFLPCCSRARSAMLVLDL